MRRRTFFAVAGSTLLAGCQSFKTDQSTNTDDSSVHLDAIHIWNQTTDTLVFEIRVWADGRTVFGNSYSVSPDEQRHVTEIPSRVAGNSIVVVGGYDGDHNSMGYNTSGPATREVAFKVEPDGQITLDGTNWTE